MNGTHVSALWMRDQDGYAIGGACRHCVAFDTSDERIALEIGDGVRCVGLGYHSHVRSVHLPLLE